MKSSSLLLALVTTLALGSTAWAAGPNRSQGNAGAGTQARSAAGTGTATHAQLHTPGTGLTDPTLAGTRPATAGPKGIHTPGTGLTTTTN